MHISYSGPTDFIIMVTAVYPWRGTLSFKSFFLVSSQNIYIYIYYYITFSYHGNLYYIKLYWWRVTEWLCITHFTWCYRNKHTLHNKHTLSLPFIVIWTTHALSNPAMGLFDWLPACVDPIGRQLMNNTASDWSRPLWRCWLHNGCASYYSSTMKWKMWNRGHFGAVKEGCWQNTANYPGWKGFNGGVSELTCRAMTPGDADGADTAFKVDSRYYWRLFPIRFGWSCEDRVCSECSINTASICHDKVWTAGAQSLQQPRTMTAPAPRGSTCWSPEPKTEPGRRRTESSGVTWRGWTTGVQPPSGSG